MKIYYSDTFDLPLPETHRFPMAKYRLLRQRVAESGEFSDCELLVPEAATDQQLLLVHQPGYVERVAAGRLTALEIRRIGFPWSPQLVERSRRSVGASIAAARAALTGGVAVNLAGGTHHAFPDSGQGYCVFNDVAVAARTMQHEGAVRRVLFVDCDVHQGNGTAAIAQHDATLFAFSIHCQRNYPFRTTRGDLDVSLREGATDDEYLRALTDGLQVVAGQFDPELVFYLAGADAYGGDRLGKLNLTKCGLQHRDQIVMSYFGQRHIPLVVCMAGGYAPEIDDIVDIHFATVRTARATVFGPCHTLSRPAAS